MHKVSTCLNERFEHAWISTPAFFGSVRHYLCDVHEGATKEIISGGFDKNCFKLLNETHTHADAWSYALRNAQELTKQWLKFMAKVISRRSATDPYYRSNRRFTSNCFRVGVCADSIFFFEQANSTSGSCGKIMDFHKNTSKKAVPMHT